MTAEGPLLVVAAVMGDAHGRVLVQQRPAGKPLAGLWEFPGGKIDKGETTEAALVRELAEELGIEVETGDVQPLTFASEQRDDGHLLLLFYRVQRWRGEPRALTAAALRWVDPAELATLPMPAADRPLVALLAAGRAGSQAG